MPERSDAGAEAGTIVLGHHSAEVVAVHHTAEDSHLDLQHGRSLQHCEVQLVETLSGETADCTADSTQLVVVAAVGSLPLEREVSSLRIGLLADGPCPTIPC